MNKIKNFNFSFGFVGDCTARVFRSLLFLLSKLGIYDFHYYSTNIDAMPEDILIFNKINNLKIQYHDSIESFLKSVNVFEAIPYRIPITVPLKKKTESEIIITEALIKKYNPDVFLLHPGPRNFELCPSVDTLKNSLFFEQAKSAIFMKMAVLKYIFEK